MPCTSPLKAWQRRPGERPKFKPDPFSRFMELPCGKCLSCRISKSREWGTRAQHEMRYHEYNCAITLTYAPEHLPEDKGLRHRDFQLFMKRLRKELEGVEIRYLMCGEYGTKTLRPHYHAIIFGYDFQDKVMIGKSASGHPLYRSPSLDRLWGLGRAIINNANVAVAEYLAKYTAKRSLDLGWDAEYKRVNIETGEIYTVAKEYIQASRGSGTKKGGLGRQFALDHLDSIYNFDNVIVGKGPRKVPTYYDKLLQRQDPARYDAIKAARKDKAAAQKLARPEEFSYRRRQVKAKVLESNYRYKHRGKFNEETS